MSQIILILALMIIVVILSVAIFILKDRLEKLCDRVQYLEHNDSQTRMTLASNLGSASNIRNGNANNIDDFYNSLKCQKTITQTELEELLQPKIQLL